MHWPERGLDETLFLTKLDLTKNFDLATLVKTIFSISNHSFDSRLIKVRGSCGKTRIHCNKIINRELNWRRIELNFDKGEITKSASSMLVTDVGDEMCW